MGSEGPADLMWVTVGTAWVGLVLEMALGMASRLLKPSRDSGEAQQGGGAGRLSGDCGPGLLFILSTQCAVSQHELWPTRVADWPTCVADWFTCVADWSIRVSDWRTCIAD